MKFIMLSNETQKYNTQAANLLKKAFPCYKDSSEEEVSHCLEEDRVAVALVENDMLLGFVGAMPQYGITAWELHPLVVDDRFRSQGIGTRLCAALEEILLKKGCLTVFLGSDDENGSTTLSNTDLFENTFEKIDSIKNLNRHPFEFYKKIGYKIIGVLPNANGMGKPDIWMAKNITTDDL